MDRQPGIGEHFDFKKAPLYAERLALLEEIKRGRREQSAESYGVASGWYFMPSSKDEDLDLDALEAVNEGSLESELFGQEKILCQNIINKLDMPNRTRPVVAVDLGGMLGLSWVRIAKKLEEERGACSSGELIMVVTNLAFNPNMFDNKVVTHGEPMNKKHRSFLGDYHHLVNYIQADVAELAEWKIELPQGTLRLKGNIDVLNEKMALAHGLTNDRDIPLLGTLLSKGGIWYFDAGKSNAPSQLQVQSPEIKAAAGEAHQIGKSALLNQPLINVTAPRDTTIKLVKSA